MTIYIATKAPAYGIGCNVGDLFWREPGTDSLTLRFTVPGGERNENLYLCSANNDVNIESGLCPLTPDILRDYVATYHDPSNLDLTRFAPLSNQAHTAPSRLSDQPSIVIDRNYYDGRDVFVPFIARGGSLVAFDDETAQSGWSFDDTVHVRIGNEHLPRLAAYVAAIYGQSPDTPAEREESTMPDIASTYRYDEETGRLHVAVTTVEVDPDVPGEVVREGGYEIVKRPLTETTRQAVFLPTEVVERIIREQVAVNNASGGANRLLNTPFWRGISRTEHDGREWIDVTDLTQMGSDVYDMTGGAWCRDGIRSTVEAIEAWRPSAPALCAEPGRFYRGVNESGGTEWFVADRVRRASDGNGVAVWRLSSETHGSLHYWATVQGYTMTPVTLTLVEEGEYNTSITTRLV